MHKAGKSIITWKEILGAMRSVAMFALLSPVLTAGWASVADAYVLSATAGTGQVTINWNSIPGATSYNLYYSTTPGVTTSTGTKVANVTNPYLVSPLTNSIPYYFVVTTVNANGEGTPSDEVGAVPGMPNAYTQSDLTGIWDTYGAVAPGPKSERGTMTINADGTFSSIYYQSTGNIETGTGTINVSTDGIISINFTGGSGGTTPMDAGRTAFVVNGSRDDGTAFLWVLIKRAASYSQNDLTGNWDWNEIGTPGPHWLQGSWAIQSDGSFTFNYVNDNNTGSGSGSGVAAITVDGTISYIASNGSVTVGSGSNNYEGCSLDAGKTVMVCVSKDIEHDDSLIDIYTKKAANYTQTDMAGTWSVRELATQPAAPWSEKGMLTVSSDGSFSGTLQVDGTVTTNNISGMISLTSSGTATWSLNPATRCSMDAGKTIMVCTGDWATIPRNAEMIVITKIESVYSYRPPAPSKIGIFDKGMWYLDKNQNWAWDGTPTDILGVFGVGLTGAIPVVGDWNGDGKTKIGVFIDGVWYLDMNNNWQWDGEGVDVKGVFGVGIPNAIPVVGDWNGDGKTKIGIYADGVWYLDVNGNWQWDGEPTDVRGVFGVGLPNAIPVTGDWNGDGKTEIGIYSNGNWYLDKNANWQWDGTPIDTFGVFGVGLPNVQPVTGDWNGNGVTKIGVYSNGYWYLDTNASWQWDGTPTDTYGIFGIGLGPVTPVTGNW